MINKFIFCTLIIFGQFIKTNEKTACETSTNQKKELEDRFNLLRSQLEVTIFETFIFKIASKTLVVESTMTKKVAEKYAEIESVRLQASSLGFTDIAADIQRYLTSSPKSAGLFDAFDKIMTSEKTLTQSLIQNLKGLINNVKFTNKLLGYNLNASEIEKWVSEFDDGNEQNLENLIKACFVMVEDGIEINDELHDQIDYKEQEDCDSKSSLSPNKAKK